MKNHEQWNAAQRVLKKLQDQGFEALLAGGAVRDLLLGHAIGDLDVASSATPDQVESLFQGQTVAVGKAFGVIRVNFQGHSIEVATYRKDLDYQDGRRPEAVVFTNRVEDAKRRDFTVNALFYDPFSQSLYDDMNGKKDLENKILKCVGLAHERFREDELRRLRLVRFVSQLGFKIEEKTLLSLGQEVEGLKKISRERITEEIGKMWKGPHLAEAFKIFYESGLATQVDPAWERSSSYATEDIWSVSRHSKAQAWAHYFSFFFEEKSLKDDHFKLYRLARDIEKFIEAVHQAYHSIPQFLKSSFGQQRLQASRESFLLGFRYYIIKKAEAHEKEKLWPVLENFEKQAALPEPLVRAQHIQDRFHGAELGRMLKKLYIEQLDQNWTNLTQAMAWLGKNS